jgi:hypothetical protein
MTTGRLKTEINGTLLMREKHLRELFRRILGPWSEYKIREINARK